MSRRPIPPAALDVARPHALRSEAEYDAAHTELISLLDRRAAVGSAAHDRLELLTALIVAYDVERSTAASYPTTPQDAVEFMLDQRGMTRSDLSDVMGGRSRVSEFFSGGRPLSTAQLQGLRGLLGLPADVLLPDPPAFTRSPSVDDRAAHDTAREAAAIHYPEHATARPRSKAGAVVRNGRGSESSAALRSGRTSTLAAERANGAKSNVDVKRQRAPKDDRPASKSAKTKPGTSKQSGRSARRG